jgi:hypothetical protein
MVHRTPRATPDLCSVTKPEPPLTGDRTAGTPLRSSASCASGWVLAFVAGLLVQVSQGALAGGIITNCTEAALLSALRGGGSVQLACDTVIPLTSTIFVNKDMVLDGTGHRTGLSSGASLATNQSRFFYVQPGVKLTLRNLTLTGGSISAANATNGVSGSSVLGAGIYVDRAVLTLEGCTLSDFRISGGAGADALRPSDRGGNGGHAKGAVIYNDGGAIVITNTVFAGNTATGGAGARGAAGASIGNGNQGGTAGREVPAWVRRFTIAERVRS